MVSGIAIHVARHPEDIVNPAFIEATIPETRSFAQLCRT